MKTIGIIGGMGPEASGDLFFKILRETDAACDQAHIPILLDSNTRIPDRTAAILSGGADPRPELIRSAKRLEQAGAEVLVMSCNTAHYFYEDIVKEISVPFLHMPRLTAEAVKEQGMKKVALLATSGTVNSGVYHRAFEVQAPETELLLPDEGGQRAVMDLIYEGIKKGREDRPLEGLYAAMEGLKARGAEVFILGCTELPLAFQKAKIQIPTVDPTLVLARSAVLAAGGRLKSFR